MTTILFTRNNPASKNIAEKLLEIGFSELENGVYKYKNIRLIDTKAATVLDVPTDFNDDLLIVLSTHKSKNDQQIFTAHYPGNWGNADFGGESKTLNTAHASKLKMIVQNVNESLKTEYQQIQKNQKLKTGCFGWGVSLEADHHGPTCDIPIIFVEIGSTEKQWNDRRAAEIMAEAVVKTVESDKKYETVFCVGEGHYPKTFNRMELESDVAVGHLLPKYSIDGLDEELFEQAIKKNVEPVKKVFVVKDSLNVKHKEKIRQLSSVFGIEYIEV